MKVVLAEKPSVARDIASVLGASTKRDGYYEGNDYAVTYAFGHLVTIAEPEEMLSRQQRAASIRVPPGVGAIGGFEHVIRRPETADRGCQGHLRGQRPRLLVIFCPWRALPQSQARSMPLARYWSRVPRPEGHADAQDRISFSFGNAKWDLPALPESAPYI